jgi:hypothetical protein
MNDLNIEEYEKLKKPESYFVRYRAVWGSRLHVFTDEKVISFPTKEEAEDYAKKIKYARKFLGDKLEGKDALIETGSFDEQFK